MRRNLLLTLAVVVVLLPCIFAARVRSDLSSVIDVNNAGAFVEVGERPGEAASLLDPERVEPVVVRHPGRRDGKVDVIIQFQVPPAVAIGGQPPEVLGRHMQEIDAERANLVGDLPSLWAEPRPFQHDYRRLFNGVATTLSQADVARAATLPYVKAVFKDEPVQAVLNDSVSLIGADQVWNLVGATGAGVRIAVIDTGVDYGHQDLGSCLGLGCKVLGGYDFVNGDADPMDDHGHGTHVAGIAAANGVVKGVAPDAEILAYKVLGADGWGSSSDIIAALEAALDPDGNPATDDGADVVNLSLGGWGDPDDPLSQAVDNGVSAGVVVAAAAGNSGPSPRSVGSPGTARKAITVGATDKYDLISYLSSRGPVIWQNGAIIKPDIVAPGVNICSSRWDSAWPGLECIDQDHVAISGTSMATPHVAGAAALLLQAHPDWTPTEVKMALRNTALDLGYDVNTQGYGRLRVLPAAQLPHAPPVASIATSGLLVDITDIYGTATSNDFQDYALYFGEGMSPASWTLLEQSTTPVSDGILHAGFDPFVLPDGYHTLRLDVSDTDGLVSQDRTLVEIDNLRVATPLNNDVLRKGDLIEIQGSILTGEAFQNYVLEWGLGHDPAEWFTSGMTLANGGTVPVVDGLLATWDTSAIGAGDYFTLRLTVTNDWGQSSEFVRDLHLDPTLKQGWPQRIPWDSLLCPFALETTWEFYSYLPRSEPGLTAPAGSVPTMWTGAPDFSTLANECRYWAGYLEPVVSDLDGNGHGEIVVYKGGEPPEILVYRDDGSLYWSVPVGTTGVPGGNVHIPLVADINNDGFPEVIAHHIYSAVAGSSELYAFGHDGSLLPGWPVFLPQDVHPTLLAADLDMDGYQEIVVKGNAAENRAMVVVSGDGQIVSQWGLPLKTWGASIESSPAVGNLDDDPELEIVSADPSEFAGYDWDTGEWNNTGVIHVYDMDGSELPGWPVYTDGIIFSSPAVGDINQDGQNEIVVGLMYAGDAPDYRYGGVYAFDRTGNVLSGWPFEKGWNFWSSPSLGDMDEDGDLEIATSRLGFVTYVIHDDGTPVAGWPQYTAWNDYYSTILGDVDGDAAPDVLTAAGTGVYAWRYDGSAIGGFPKVTEVDAQAPATIADIDQDGQVELVASSDWDHDSEAQTGKSRGSLYVWDIAATYDALSMEWPHFHHDAQHTGLYNPDTDADGCADGEELGADPALGGQRDPLNPYDFYDVPVPTAFNGGTLVDRDQAITIIDDLLAVLEYSGTSDGGPCNSGPDGIPSTPDDRCYNQDNNGDTLDDGMLYDRSVGALWSDAPDAAITIIVDVLLVLAQSGHSCQAPP